MDRCDLCAAVSDGLRSKYPKIANVVLAESQYFVLLPCIGPLVVGHALLISREHHMSLASMTREAIIDYEQFVLRLRSLPEVKGNLLEAEHGPTRMDNAGSCISHTHINILPGLSDHEAMLAPSMPRIGTIPALADLQTIIDPYIFIRGASREIAIYQSAEAPSQAIRREICRRIGREDWDWAVSPGEELIQKTVEFWKRILANA